MALIERVAGYHRMPQELFEQGPKDPHQQTALIQLWTLSRRMRLLHANYDILR